MAGRGSSSNGLSIFLHTIAGVITGSTSEALAGVNDGNTIFEDDQAFFYEGGFNDSDTNGTPGVSTSGLEIVIPAGLGLETRGMFEVIPKDSGDSGSWKNLIWFVGANFHFGGQ